MTPGGVVSAPVSAPENVQRASGRCSASRLVARARASVAPRDQWNHCTVGERWSARERRASAREVGNPRVEREVLLSTRVAGGRDAEGVIVKDAVDREGAPTTHELEPVPGLFFCGLYVSPFGMLRQIAIDAQRIAAAIAAA